MQMWKNNKKKFQKNNSLYNESVLAKKEKENTLMEENYGYLSNKVLK